jgi:uncharacterized RDD family membrane protein YckC
MSESEDEFVESLDDTPRPPSTANTVVPRYIAALLDNCVAMLLAVVGAKSVSSDLPLTQFALCIVVYLGYYFAFETLLARTPGKLLTGLIVVDVHGEKCSAGQSAIRTLFRILEVNPLLFGALPAAFSIIFFRHHQRIGDKLAKTFVVNVGAL